MSVVGPPAPLRREIEAYGDDVQRRLLAKAGSTGLWQVIPEGAGPVKTNVGVVLVRSASFLVGDRTAVIRAVGGSRIGTRIVDSNFAPDRKIRHT